jgi:hypothetical protein
MWGNTPFGVRTRSLKLRKQKSEALTFGTQHTDREIAEKSSVTQWKTFTIIILAAATAQKGVSRIDTLKGPETRIQ